MKIFVTGSTGFIGSHFVNTALSHGIYVKALRRLPSSNPRVPLRDNPKWITGEMLELNRQVFEDVDVLVHLAAHSANHPYDNIHQCLYWNLMAPLRLFDIARNAGVRSYVVAGSCFEYGKSGERYKYIPANAPLEPTATYPTSKAAASISFIQWAKQYDLSLSLCRIFQVYGPGECSDRLWPSLVRSAKLGQDFKMSPGEQIRDFIHVHEVAHRLFERCCDLHESKQPIVTVSNVGTGQGRAIYDFCQSIWNQCEARGKLIRSALPYRPGEVMRYVPCLKQVTI